MSYASQFLTFLISAGATAFAAEDNQPIFELVATGMACPHETFITWDPDLGCDGWPRTSLDECKEHCKRGDLPANCRATGQACGFVQWDNNPDWPPGWCHLGGAMCNSTYKANNGQQLWSVTYPTTTSTTTNQPIFELVATGITCPYESFITWDPEIEGCNGWSHTSLDECKEHCKRGDLPAPCRATGQSCGFVQWDENPGYLPGWCHLGGVMCNSTSEAHHTSQVWLMSSSTTTPSSTTESQKFVNTGGRSVDVFGGTVTFITILMATSVYE